MNSAPPPQAIVILISGRGSNMHALIEHSRQGLPHYRVAAVLSDQPGAAGLATARSLGIPTRELPLSKGTPRVQYDADLAAAVLTHAPALVVLAGFMRILSPPFVARFAGRVLNIHPSLLPKYPGLHTHGRVLRAADAEHGATVHFVTDQLDGGPAVVQGRVAVLPGDTEQSLAARVQRQEHRILPLAVDWFCAGRLRCMDGCAWLDGGPLAAAVQFAEVPEEGYE